MRQLEREQKLLLTALMLLMAAAGLMGVVIHRAESARNRSHVYTVHAPPETMLADDDYARQFSERERISVIPPATEPVEERFERLPRMTDREPVQESERSVALSPSSMPAPASLDQDPPNEQMYLPVSETTDPTVASSLPRHSASEFFDRAQINHSESLYQEVIDTFPESDEARQASAILVDMRGRDLPELVQAGTVEVNATGSGIQNLAVRMRRTVAYPVTVAIPVGTYFVSSNPSTQNMITTSSRRQQLRSDDWVSLRLPVACANMRRNIPGSEDAFTVQASSSRADLARLIPVLDRANVSFGVRQAAVWIVTDDASYSALGNLVSRPVGVPLGGSRIVGPREAARAMQLCEDAGIDIAQKRIWRDRQTIFDALDDGTLKTWMRRRIAGGSM